MSNYPTYSILAEYAKEIEPGGPRFGSSHGHNRPGGSTHTHLHSALYLQLVTYLFSIGLENKYNYIMQILPIFVRIRNIKQVNNGMNNKPTI